MFCSNLLYKGVFLFSDGSYSVLYLKNFDYLKNKKIKMCEKDIKTFGLNKKYEQKIDKLSDFKKSILN